MKKIYKFLLMTIVVSSTMFYSCETLELENLASPNGLDPSKADADLLLNSIQLAYRASLITFNDNNASLARIDYFFGRDYFEDRPGIGGPWNNLYSGMLPDIANIAALHSAENDLSFQLGISKIMQAHVMMLLVDSLGDIVYSQANNPSEYPAPAVDDDQEVYNAALALLVEAKAHLASAPGTNATDMFYGNDNDKWITFANTLQMRANLTVGNYSAVASATNVITDTADDMEFAYGTNVLAPDTRHPDYNADYRSDGANIYQNNWLMNQMTGDSDEWYNLWGVWEIGDDMTPADPLPTNDPRRRYYFYRQSWNTPGNFSMLYHSAAGTGAWPEFFGADSTNGETLQCSLQNVPFHLEFTPDEEIWCSTKLGYWGRTHGNDEGTPPDNFLRTASGVYPAGGSFDNQYDIPFYQGGSGVGNLPSGAVGLGNGGGGAGVEPIMLASYVYFMKAEAELALGNTAAARTHLETAITTSINKVMSFGALDAAADSDLFPTAVEIDDFMTTILGEFDAAPETSGLDGFGFPVEKDKWDILGEQYFVAMFGGSADAFNFIRRTGYPRTITRQIEPDPGSFPRTLLYPSAEIIANPNITQRTNLSTQVFWDQGVTNPAN